MTRHTHIHRMAFLGGPCTVCGRQPPRDLERVPWTPALDEPAPKAAKPAETYDVRKRAAGDDE